MAPNRKGTATERNRRKRKRKPVDFESSSDSSSESDTEVTSIPPPAPSEPSGAESESSSESSSSGSSSESENEEAIRAQKTASVSKQLNAVSGEPQRTRQPPSRSPSPRPSIIPSFLPENSDSNAEGRNEKERLLKERFSKLWMATIADEFKTDLEEIRKEPGLTQSRLAMLIDGLSSGADAFSSGSSKNGRVNEMELVLEAEEITEASSSSLHF